MTVVLKALVVTSNLQKIILDIPIPKEECTVYIVEKVGRGKVWLIGKLSACDSLTQNFTYNYITLWLNIHTYAFAKFTCQNFPLYCE